MQEYNFLITEELEGMRLDKAVTELLDGAVSRNTLQKSIKEKQVLVNDKVVKSSYCLKYQDLVHIHLEDKTEATVEAEEIPLSILYEDDDVAVIDKPKGMVVHPGAGHFSGTLVNALLFHYGENLSTINGPFRPGIVHRIDKDTSGSLMICKNNEAHYSLAKQLKEHSIIRKYRAICCGVLKEDSGTIEAPIGRDEKNRLKMGINRTNGKTAITHYRVLERFQEYSYIECQLETGRTHQIRVHMASIGHPLYGDTVYSNRKWKVTTNGQCLHAFLLGFIQPHTGEYIETYSPIPTYFSELLGKLRQN